MSPLCRHCGAPLKGKTMPKMIPVDSSTIREIGYDVEEHRLIVVFNSGGRYSYDGVPVDLWDKFLTSKSKGRFFAEEIKHNYRFKRSEIGEVG